MTEQHCCDDCRYLHTVTETLCYKRVNIRTAKHPFLEIEDGFDPVIGYRRSIARWYNLFNKNGTCPYFSHKNIFIRLYQWMKKK